MAVQDTRPQLTLRRGLQRPRLSIDQQRGLSGRLSNTPPSALTLSMSPRDPDVEGVL